MENGIGGAVWARAPNIGALGGPVSAVWAREPNIGALGGPVSAVWAREPNIGALVSYVIMVSSVGFSLCTLLVL